MSWSEKANWEHNNHELLNLREIDIAYISSQ